MSEFSLAATDYSRPLRARHFIYFVNAGAASGVYTGSLDGTSSKRLTNANAAAVVSTAGFLLFLRQTTLFAQAFDFKRCTDAGKTTFHQLAHIELGHTSEAVQDSEALPRSLKEVEAESVALLCLGIVGNGGAEYCRGYIQNWLSGATIPEQRTTDHC